MTNRGGLMELPLRAANNTDLRHGQSESPGHLISSDEGTMSEKKNTLSKNLLGLVFGFSVETKKQYEEVCKMVRDQDVPDWDTFRALGDQQFLVRPNAVGGPSDMPDKDFQKWATKWRDWRFTPILDWQSEHNVHSKSSYRYSSSTYIDAVKELELKLELKAHFDPFSAWCCEAEGKHKQHKDEHYKVGETELLRLVKEAEKGFSVEGSTPPWFGAGGEPPVPLAATSRNYTLFTPSTWDENAWISPSASIQEIMDEDEETKCMTCKHCKEREGRREQRRKAEGYGTLPFFVLKQDNDKDITECCFRGLQLGYLIHSDETIRSLRTGSCIPIAFRIDDTLTRAEGLYLIDPRKVECYGYHWVHILNTNVTQERQSYMIEFGRHFDTNELDKIFEGCFYRRIDIETGKFTGAESRISGQAYLELLEVNEDSD